MKWMLTVWCFSIYQKPDNSQYSNYQVISLLSAAYKLLPNIILYNVTAYAEKNIGNSQFGFRFIDRGGSHIVYWSDCGGRIERVKDSADCKKCKGKGSADCKNWKGEGIADCKNYKGRKVQTAGTERGRELQTARNVRGREVQTARTEMGRELQTARNSTIRLGRSFYLISQSV